MATTWYYYANGQKHGTVTGGQLKWLAKNGKITPETLVENEEGKSVLAGTIKGLTFIETAPSDEPATFSFPCPNCNSTLQAKRRSAGKTKDCPTCAQSFTVPADVASPLPIETEIYGMASPPTEPSPFTVSLSETVRTPVTASSGSENPFTAAMSVSTPTMPPSIVAPPVAAKPAADSPFTATMPMATQTIPQSDLPVSGWAVCAACVALLPPIGLIFTVFAR